MKLRGITFKELFTGILSPSKYNNGINHQGPDFFGTIQVSNEESLEFLKRLTMQDNIRISAWKKKSKKGNQYLSLSISVERNK
jgi:hypothetical protein